MQKLSVIIDAKDKSLGRVASEAAHLLRGKGEPTFEPNRVPRISVVITNASHVRFSGRKFVQGSRERYSGYPGGLRYVSYAEVFAKSPSRLMREAISGMIPRNRLKDKILKNLIIYAGNEK